MILEILMLVIAYILGAVPFGFIIVKLVQRQDIRTMGSGNIGATNVLRSGKKAQGVITLLLDAGKGALAVLLTGWVLAGSTPEWIAVWQSLAAVAAVFGHIYPLFLGFRGGKGVATGCGAYMAMIPIAVVTTLVVFALVVVLTRYVSLGSILATALFPLWAYLYGYGEVSMFIIYCGIGGAMLIVSRHKENIARLVRGNENRLKFSSRGER
jgi:glycerol-3-phosphate acyltransferase PlsY